MATDDELNPTSYELFTKSTAPGPGTGIRPLVYVDMRGNAWRVTWDIGSQTWSVVPEADTYGMPGGKLAFFGETASVLIDAIEAHAEAWRVANKLPPKDKTTPPHGPPSEPDSGGLMFLALIAAVLYYADKKKGRR